MLIISQIEKNSVGKELRLKKGWKVISFDGNSADDIIDYLFYDAKEQFVLCVEDLKGRRTEYEIEKDTDETLGLSFESDGLEMRTCHNNCIFCFVDQMPPGMRQTLYVKDDDYRQSVLCGNFVTLTNLCEKDVLRIENYKLSPLYISVHSMNPTLRCNMMNNRFAGKIVEYIDRFARAGITMHTQIVLVPGVNDGKELEYSARELFKHYPSVQTLAVVPCGITRHRDGLYPIEDASVDFCKAVIHLADKLNGEFGVNFINLADEFYFKAGQDVKPYEFYGDFPQIENGVGMTAKFHRELTLALSPRTYDRRVLLACGTSAHSFISRMAKTVEDSCKCLKTHVIGVENKFFGSTVNCSGLLVGKDVLDACKACDWPYDEVVIPSNMLREFEDVFLDGMTVSELSASLGKKIKITCGSGESFFDALTLPCDLYKGRNC